MEPVRFEEETLFGFIVKVFVRLGVDFTTARLGARSLLDASLMGIDSHGVESLEMYVTHIKNGGLKADVQPLRIKGGRSMELWDMQHGMGLAAGRTIMEHAIRQAREYGVHMATCRNANHIGACGVYAKMAADEGMIGMVSQQVKASLSPWGGRDVRVGSSPFAFVAPVLDGFPFFFDAGMAAITRYQIKDSRKKGCPLPQGVALDSHGNPTRDPEKAWNGQIIPIGGHKGVGLAMVFEILSGVMSASRFSNEISSIVDHPDKPSGSSLFMAAIDPEAVGCPREFTAGMRRYVDYIESSTPRDPSDTPRYPGRREGENWSDRKENGIPVSCQGLQSLEKIAVSLSVDKPVNQPLPS